MSTVCESTACGLPKISRSREKAGSSSSEWFDRWSFKPVHLKVQDGRALARHPAPKNLYRLNDRTIHLQDVQLVEMTALALEATSLHLASAAVLVPERSRT
jgi:hypothetical protein